MDAVNGLHHEAAAGLMATGKPAVAVLEGEAPVGKTCRRGLTGVGGARWRILRSMNPYL